MTLYDFKCQDFNKGVCCFSRMSLHATSLVSVIAELSDADRKMNPSTKIEPVNGGRHLMLQLISAMWLLHQAHPANMALAPVCVPGEMCVKLY